VNSDNDLPHEQNTPQQQSRFFKPPIWKVIFTLLLIANLLIGGWSFLIIYSVFWGELSHISAGGMSLIAVISPLLILSIIDFIAVLIYIITQHPQGIAKIISYTAFIAISLVLIFAALYVPKLFNSNFDISLIIANPFFIVAIFIIVTTFLTVRFLHQKSHK
jgi:magnesium-transporting ATPase (P-type)